MRLLHSNAFRDVGQDQRIDADAFLFGESGELRMEAFWNIEVIVAVDQSCAQYFRRRKVYPHQEIKEERADGSIVVSFKVGSLDEITNILKGWLPHIKILQPEGLKNIFLNDMKTWICRQEES